MGLGGQFLEPLTERSFIRTSVSMMNYLWITINPIFYLECTAKMNYFFSLVLHLGRSQNPLSLFFFLQEMVDSYP